MPKKPPDHTSRTKSTTITCKHILIIIILTITLVLATTILALGTRTFCSWYRNIRPLKRQNDVLFYTIVFVMICIPICAFPGMLVAAAYYWRKKKKYGKFDAKMRRKKEGRGYWLDPSDLEDRKKADEAKRANTEVEKGTGEEVVKIEISDELPVVDQQQNRTFGSSVEQQSNFMRTQKYSSFNPYGWFPEGEDVATAQQALGRSDSVRTYKDRPVVKKGVVDDWLNSFGNRVSDGQTKGKDQWGEDMEMGVIRQRTL